MAPGPLQILIIVLLILVVFGASRLPSIAENLAKGINSFKKGLKDDDAPKQVDDKSDKDS
ncbi:MAG: twin-arginine translocase TatA/TatE family subunit [Pseudomonadota bacterium]